MILRHLFQPQWFCGDQMQVFEKDFLRNVSYLLHLIPIYWYLVQVASVAWILVRKLPIKDVHCIKQDERENVVCKWKKKYNGALCILSLVNLLYSFSDWLLFLAALSWPPLPPNCTGENVSKAILCSCKHIANNFQWTWLGKEKNDSIKMYRDVFETPEACINALRVIVGSNWAVCCMLPREHPAFSALSWLVRDVRSAFKYACLFLLTSLGVTRWT